MTNIKKYMALISALLLIVCFQNCGNNFRSKSPIQISDLASSEPILGEAESESLATFIEDAPSLPENPTLGNEEIVMNPESPAEKEEEKVVTPKPPSEKEEEKVVTPKPPAEKRRRESRGKSEA